MNGHQEFSVFVLLYSRILFQGETSDWSSLGHLLRLGRRGWDMVIDNPNKTVSVVGG